MSIKPMSLIDVDTTVSNLRLLDYGLNRLAYKIPNPNAAENHSSRIKRKCLQCGI